MNAQNTNRSPARWLFPMLALGGLSASLGRVGVWIGLALGGPLICYLLWTERSRWAERQRLHQRLTFVGVSPDEIRLTYDGVDWALPDGRRVGIAWTDVCGIAAYVEPQPAGDTLMLSLRIALQDSWISFSAEADGFDILRLALKDRFAVPFGWEASVWRGKRGLNWLRLWGDAPPPGEVCWKCKYDLRGNESGVCPECGTIFVWPAPKLN